MLQLGDKNMFGGEEGDVGSMIYIYIERKKRLKLWGKLAAEMEWW